MTTTRMRPALVLLCLVTACTSWRNVPLPSGPAPREIVITGDGGAFGDKHSVRVRFAGGSDRTVRAVALRGDSVYAFVTNDSTGYARREVAGVDRRVLGRKRTAVAGLLAFAAYTAVFTALSDRAGRTY